MSEREVGAVPEGREEVVVADYRVSASVLEAIVRWSIAGDGRLRLAGGGARGGRHPVSVSVDDSAGAAVVVRIRALLGEDLQELGSWIRETVALRLAGMTGLGVTRVDVHVEGVFPPGEPESLR